MTPILREGHYYGTCETRRQAGPLVLSNCAYRPGLEIPKHTHENPYLIVVVQGSQEENLGSDRRSYVPGTVAFHPAGEVHSQRLGSRGLRCLHVEFAADWMQRYAPIFRGLRDGLHVQGRPFSQLAHRAYRELQYTDELVPMAIEGLVLEILAEAARVELDRSLGGRPPWLRQAKDLIHAHFRDSLSLADVASAVGVHSVHLARAFRKQYRASVGEYIRQLRIQAACEALQLQDGSLAHLAVKLGFADQAHFTRTFKRLVGVTPGEFRVFHGRR